MVRPVSSLAGLLPPEAVSPLTPGSASLTFKLVLGGNLTAMGLLLKFWMSTSLPSIKKSFWELSWSWGRANCS